jgi:hypothetical protein
MKAQKMRFHIKNSQPDVWQGDAGTEGKAETLKRRDI